MAATFELFQDKKGEFRWRLRHQNGNVIADSGEGYTTKGSLLNGIDSVRTNAPTAPIEDQTEAE
ncbi:MAG: HVO_2922 family protein [Dehalogenimonas sp.]